MISDSFRPSIIITSYNKVDLLIESIDSVIAQTMRPHEIIIVDDGSTDGSWDVIHEYTERHPGWIKGLYQLNNVGIPANRNTALRTVTGNYVGILDGDDLFVPDKLEKQYRALCDLPNARAVYSNFRRIKSDGTFLTLRWDRPQAEGDILEEVAMLNYGLLRTMLASYEAVKQVGYMDERYTKFDGFWLSIQLASFCRFAYVDEVLLEKKEYPESDSQQNTKAELLHDISGIYRDMQSVIARLGPAKVQAINLQWQKRMTIYEG